MIEFIYEPQDSVECFFKDVQHNQFFINLDGDLCQKINDFRFNIIADSGGTPDAYETAQYAPPSHLQLKIRKILPKVYKIIF